MFNQLLEEKAKSPNRILLTAFIPAEDPKERRSAFLEQEPENHLSSRTVTAPSGAASRSAPSGAASRSTPFSWFRPFPQQTCRNQLICLIKHYTNELCAHKHTHTITHKHTHTLVFLCTQDLCAHKHTCMRLCTYTSAHLRT